MLSKTDVRVFHKPGVRRKFLVFAELYHFSDYQEEEKKSGYATIRKACCFINGQANE